MYVLSKDCPRFRTISSSDPFGTGRWWGPFAEQPLVSFLVVVGAGHYVARWAL